MELREAKEVLNENGYLMESVKIDNIEKFDRDIEFHTERLKKIRLDFIKIAEDLQEPVFSKLGSVLTALRLNLSKKALLKSLLRNTLSYSTELVRMPML